MVSGGWQWLAVGGWSPLAVGGGWWRLVVGGWWRLAVDGSWRLAVGGPLGRSLRAVLCKKKIWSLKDRPATNNVQCFVSGMIYRLLIEIACIYHEWARKNAVLQVRVEYLHHCK